MCSFVGQIKQHAPIFPSLVRAMDGAGEGSTTMIKFTPRRCFWIWKWWARVGGMGHHGGRGGCGRKWEGRCQIQWNITGRIIERWSKLQKEICVNYFASVLLGKVAEVANNFFNKIVSMTLIVTLERRLWECSWNKINKATVVRILYFKAVSLVFRNSAIN